MGDGGRDVAERGRGCRRRRVWCMTEEVNGGGE